MASPEDLLAQRNKIQRQILALETTLGADSNIADLLSSDSDSESVSEDGEHAGVQEAQDVLEAERQQILQEIKELEKTLGPNAALVGTLTDTEHGTGSQVDSSDEDSDAELHLPQDLETCLQMNLVYQEVLKEKLGDLERLLNENRQQQEDIEAQLSGQFSTSKQPHLKLFLGSFMKPYFKDKLTGLGPPSNEETRERLSHGKRPCDELKIRRWNGWQKTLLIDSVIKDTMKRMQQPKMSKMEYLTSKISKAEDKEKEELKRQITLLEKEIKEISSMKEDQLYGGRFDDHDWEKISNIDFEGLRHPEDLMRFWQNYMHPSINKSTWSQDETEKLSSIVVKYKRSNWDQIAEALGTNRSAFMCFQTYQRYISKTFRKRNWTKEEDQILRDLVEKMRIGNFIPYTQLSYFMEGRDHAQLMYRWTTVLDPSLKKGPWSKEEDQLLLKAVEKFGCKDWYKIRLEVPGRTDSSCRDRYLDCLRTDVKRGPWSKEEVELLKKMVEKYGVGKWTKIASEIPNRIDCQCLNKWKSMMQKKGTKRAINGPSQGSWSKKRKVMKKKSEEEEEEEKEEEEEEVVLDSTSEDEDVKVEYLDSDEEEQTVDDKLVVSSEEEMEHREEYIQPDIKEWIPAGRNAFVRPAGIMRTILVRLPTVAEEQDCGKSVASNPSTLHHQSNPVRSTVLDHLGNPIKTYMGMEPPALPVWDCCNENAMDKVPVDDVLHLLTWSSKSHNKKARMRKEQNDAKRNRQKTKSTRSQKSRGTTKDANMQTSLDYALLLAVIPWVGNVMIPLPFSKKRVYEADIVRKRATSVHLPKTGVFLLFLKALHIYTEGCKKVIEAREASKSQMPPLRYPLICNPSSPRAQPRIITDSRSQTVAKLLAKRGQHANSPKPTPSPPETEQPAPPAPPNKMPIPRNKPQRKPRQVLKSATQITGPTLMVPQAFFTQSKAHQGMCAPQPVGQGILPLLQSQGALNICQPVLQVVLPVEPQKTAQPETLHLTPATTAFPTKRSGKVKTPKTAPPTTSTSSPSTAVPPTTSTSSPSTAVLPTTSTSSPSTAVLPTTSTSSPSTAVPPTSSAEVKRKRKRICKPTMKAQAFMANAKKMSSKKQMVENSQGCDNTSTTVNTVETPPQTTAWVLTPTGLMPLGEIHITSSGFLDNQNPVKPNAVPQMPPGIVNQNSSFTVVSSVQPSKSNDVSSLLSINKDLNNSSTANTKAPLVPLNATNVPTSLSSPADQSEITGSQNQTILSIVPQMTIQSPIIVNQNGALTLLCDAVRPPVPLNESVTPKPVAYVPVGTSQKSMPSSGLSTTSGSSVCPANSVLSFSSPSAVTHTPAILPARPSVLTLSSPVIQMPSTFPNVLPSPAAPIQHTLLVKASRLAKGQLHANKRSGRVTSRSQTLPKTRAPQCKKQTLPPAPAASKSSPKPDPLHFDPNLMFLEHPDQVKNWLKGNKGISLPSLEDKMPYLPPFVSSVNTLVSLLKAKDSLLKAAVQLLPEEDQGNSGEEEKVAAVRKLISDKFKTNPAYLLLKARFLSCFTLPALLATIHPCKERRDGYISEDNNKDQGSLLSPNECEESDV